MKTFLKKNLALLLVLCTILSVCPLNVMATDEGTTAESAEVQDTTATDSETAEEGTTTEEGTTEEGTAAEEGTTEEGTAAEEGTTEEDTSTEEASADPSGTCGEALTWVLTDDGTLTISGEGAMTDWATNEAVSWYDALVSITNVVIEEGVTNIGTYAFYGCSALTSVTIPADVTIIGDAAFSGCSALVEINYGGSAGTWADVLVGSDNDCLKTATIDYAISDVASGDCGTALTWVLTDDGTLTISGEGDMTAFDADQQPWADYVSDVTSVVVEVGVTSIGDYAFSGCSSLTAVELAETVDFIGEYAFSGCTSLVSIELPNAVATLGNYAFNNCAALTSINIPDNVAELPMSYDGILTGTYFCSVFTNCSSLVSVEIGASLQTLCSGTFAASANLTSATFRNPSTIIQDYAVGYHEDSTYVSNGSVTITGYANSTAETYAAANDFNFVSLGLFKENGTVGENLSWTLESGVLTISGQGAMGEFSSKLDVPWYIYRNTIHTVVIEEGVTNIGAYAFFECSAMTSIEVPASVTSIGTMAFYHCKSLESIVVPAVAAIPDSTFLECTSLKSVVVTDGPVSIGKVAFGVTSTAYDAASGTNVSCGALSEVFLPDSITSIADTAFYGNTNAVIYYCTAGSAAHNYALEKGMTASQHYYSTDSEGATTCVYCGAASTLMVQPEYLSVVAGDKATFTVDATGSSLTYQWQYRTATGTKWNNSTLKSAKTSTLTVTSKVGFDGYTYRCKVTDSSGNIVYSNGATLRVTGIKTQPKDTTVVAGKKASFSVKATGSGLTYQWQYKTATGTKWYNNSVSSAKTSTLTVTSRASYDGYSYRCKITDAEGNVVYTRAAILTITNITTQPADTAVIAGDKASFSVVATGPDLTYQWQYKTPTGTKWNNNTVSSAKTSTLTITSKASYNEYIYRCKITDGTGNVVYSNTATLYVTGIKTQPDDAAVVAGDEASFSIVATGTDLTYQWQYKTATGTKWYNSSLASGKTSTMTLTTRPSHDGYSYRCMVTDTAGNIMYSDTASLRVTGIKTQPDDVVTVAGNKASFSVVATGPDLTYRWQYKTATGTKWYNSSLTSAKTSTMTLTTKSSHDGYSYRCMVTDGAGNVVYSDTVSLHVTSIKTQPVAAAVVAGDKASFSIVATGTDLTYQWQYKTATGTKWYNSSLTSGKTSTMTLTTRPSHDGYSYRCMVTDTAGNTVYSDTVSLRVTGIKTQPDDAVVAAGDKATFSVVATGPDLTYQWQYKTATGTKWNNSSLSSAKTSTLTISGKVNLNGYTYRCKITDGAGNVVYSDGASLTVLGAQIDGGTCGDNLTWTITNDGLLTISGTGAMDDYLSGDGNNAPWGDYCDQILAVEMDDGITTIGDGAFAWCGNLESVTLPANLTSIGNSAFYYCTTIEAVALPDTVIWLGQSVFAYCSNLNVVILSEGLDEIAISAFENDTNLAAIYIPEGVTVIRKRAFMNCTALTEIYYGGSLDSFYAIYIDEGNDSLANVTLYYYEE